jgi:ABC-type multidrug transport system ATPase subunit
MADSSIIQVTDLVKAYGLLPVLRKLNLSIERGESVALLGPNGAGKSTLLRLLASLSKPTSGTIRVGGWELPREAAAVRAQLGLVSHKPLLYDNLTANENLAFFGRLYGLPADERARRSAAMLARVGLGKRGDDLVRTFSRGMLQRLSIARALLHNPSVLLFDEPYTGLDQDASRTLDELLLEARGEGRTIIVTLHQFDRVADLCSRVTILARGVIAYDAPTAGHDALSLAGEYTRVTGMATAR